MWDICKKEFSQFFSSLTGYLAIILFLLINGLFLFVLQESSIFEYGYAGMDKFFELAPWVLLLLVPAITMRTLADEFKHGTYEILITRPLTPRKIIWGKFWAVALIILLVLLPSTLYIITIQSLSAGGNIDLGGIAGSYIGLILLALSFSAIGITCSGFGSNALLAFLLSAFISLVFYFGFDSISHLPAFKGTADYYIEMLGLNFHYLSMSKGVIDSRDVVYFFSFIIALLYFTEIKLSKRS
jgi:ABC-2 type transport system permease protein